MRLEEADTHVPPPDPEDRHLGPHTRHGVLHLVAGVSVQGIQGALVQHEAVAAVLVAHVTSRTFCRTPAQEQILGKCQHNLLIFLELLE